ncbi:ABC transporter ATP-binding protein [Falsiroseomonas oryzae]|uniref:ABC transporter ATP-binding protein n=1 Tax=Falsiroseomonas oryzae TaxID=2766473 RepID=UPI0022EA590E|nr:ABC transporter ATP-binding protein [Roseomonas sp. MO-31]
MTPLLDIRGYRLAFDGFEGRAEVLDGIDLAVQPGETVGIVGETGCGKSVLARSIARLVEMPPGRVLGGSIAFEGQDVFAMDGRALARLRGHGVAMIFQDPMTYLNPVFSIGSQMVDVIRAHDRAEGRSMRARPAARTRAAELLAAVRLPEPDRLLDRYPHELSGGMRQRVLIAMALSGEPRMLVADEPTTALDVTIQAQVLRLIAELVATRGLTLLLISHDLGVIGALCRRVVVMYAGTVVEDADAGLLFDRPRHPYTRGLLAAVPDLARPDHRVAGIPGHIPNLLAPPGGCRFHPRCPLAIPRCAAEKPGLRDVDGRRVACHRAEEAA